MNNFEPIYFIVRSDQINQNIFTSFTFLIFAYSTLTKHKLDQTSIYTVQCIVYNLFKKGTF